MPHAHHFLERLDRVTREQTELALSLYRDHEAVRYVLSHVKLAEGASRVALALADSPDGPFVIVTTDGGFVTCLGQGMRHDHPVVSRSQLGALLAKVADKRARRELAQRELRPDEEEENLFHRILTRGSRLAREDFIALSAFEPLLGFGPFLAMHDMAVDAVESRGLMTIHAKNATVNGTTQKALERLDRIEWSVAHLAVLTGAADRRELDGFLNVAQSMNGSPTVACALQGGSTFYLRAAWMAARFGKVLLPAYRSAFTAAGNWMSALDAGMGLGAIALRHASAMPEVKRSLEGMGPSVAQPLQMDDVRANIAGAILDVMANADERLGVARKLGADFVVKYGEQLPEGHARRYTLETVPDELARAAVLGFDGDMYDPGVQGMAILLLPTAARAAAEDFYLPRDVVRAWRGAWSAEETLERLKRFARAETRVPPRKAEKTPGRNDPCSCGSGKKWKKCHGGVGSEKEPL